MPKKTTAKKSPKNLKALKALLASEYSDAKLLVKKAAAFDRIIDILYPTAAMLREDYEDDYNGGTDGAKPSDQDLLDWYEWDSETIEFVAEQVLQVYPKAQEGIRTLK